MGEACSLVLYAAHKSLAADGSLGLRVCLAGSDCATVLAHPKAVLWGLPLAGWGVLYFLGMGAAPIVFGMPRRSTAWGRIMAAAAIVGVSVSIACLRWMGAVIGAWCPWCTAAHAANFLMCGLIVWHWARHEPRSSTVGRGIEAGAAPASGVTRLDAAERRPAVRDRDRGAVVVRAAVVSGAMALLAGVLALFSTDIRAAHARRFFPGPGAVGEIVNAWRASAPGDVRLAGDELVLGDPRGAHTLVMFTDLCCPYCRQAHADLSRLVRRLADVRVAIKQFPFHPSCNPAVRVARRRYRRSCQVARAVQAVAATGDVSATAAFAESVLLVESPEELDAEALAAIARQAGLDTEAWSHARHSEEVRSRVDRDVAEGRRLGVESVPAFFLDGRALRDAFILDADTNEVDWSRTDELWRELLGRSAAGYRLPGRPSPPATSST